MTNTDAIAEQLGSCYTAVVHDVLRDMGHKNFLLPAELRPLLPGKTMSGPAFTIEGHPDESVDNHDTLLAWTGILSEAPSGHVWVCQPNTHDTALMGELSAETLQKKGLVGCVIDGKIRDSEFMVKSGFQNFHIGFTPRDIPGRWMPVATRAAIHIGEVRIEQGDFIVGDRDGVLRVPRDIAAEVAEKSVTAMHAENTVRSGIMDGMDPQEAYLKYNKF
ncbi:RraA family protein [Thalassorhabdomicrobium marinisediminis]|uniref:RraA family protein n=1 Tax=Thalassorhabdomicrobium marinisediminis TaxID=2170577 RepID=UPI002492547C|nr:RraA family protein [Thalassorhabdomicrobium marinisediminis]